MKTLYIASLALCAILLGTACSKDILKEESPSSLTAEQLFKDKSGFEYALNGLHSQVRMYRAGQPSDPTNNLMCTQAVIGVDNGYGNYRVALIDVFNLYGNYYSPSFSHFDMVFEWLYQTINAANTIVNRAEKAEINWTEAEKNAIVAEARLIRAWCYRHLTYLWGDVPLTLTESSGTAIKTDWERTPVSEVRKTMEADLLFAEQYLPEVSASDIRLIKGAAQHYLAELYLATGEYDKAKTVATRVVANLNYRLVTARYGVNKNNPGTAFSDMFLSGNSKRSEGNTEALWVIQNEEQVIGGEANNIMRRSWVNRYETFKVGNNNISPFPVSEENGGRGIGRLAPTRWAMNLYAANDERGSDHIWRHYYILRDPTKIPTGTNPRTGVPYKLGDAVYLPTNTVEKHASTGNPAWPSTRKWDNTSKLDMSGAVQYNDQFLLRTAETYLVLAEANFRLGDLEGAADAINALRARAKASSVTAAQVTIDLILDERSRELFSEEDRRYALVRTRKLVERVKLYNKAAAPNITDRDTLLPIPQTVIDANLTKRMPQNSGW